VKSSFFYTIEPIWCKNIVERYRPTDGTAMPTAKKSSYQNMNCPPNDVFLYLLLYFMFISHQKIQ